VAFMLKGFILGVLAVLAALAGAFYVVMFYGYFPANADARPPWLEKYVATRALDAVIAKQMSSKPNPVAETDANLVQGIKLYAVHCAVCHGAADAKPSSIALGLYQKAPQLAKYGVEDDEDGVTYWKIYHGIRMTGMPAFRQSLSEDEMWKIALFLKKMDALPPGPEKVWKAVPSAARTVPTDVKKRGAE